MRTPTTITFLGMTRRISEWARLLETTPQVLRYRLLKDWRIEEVLEIKEHDRGKKIKLSGLSLSISQWSEKVGIPANTIRTRLRRGWPVSLAIQAPKHLRLEDYEHEERVRGLKRFLFWITGYSRSTP